MGLNIDGRRKWLGLKVGDSNSESEGFWTEFLAPRKERGLTGFTLVISDAHLGLTKAIRRQLQGCVCQRCRVHFARNPAAAGAQSPSGHGHRGPALGVRPGERSRDH